MKTTLRLISHFFILLSVVSNSFSTPLNGAYTIGIGGNYPTIQSAFDDAAQQGISGPVIFNVITGTYNETVMINGVSNGDTTNTITLRSLTGNSADVIINGISFFSANDIIIDKLSIAGSGNVNFDHSNHISITNIRFSGGSLYSSFNLHDIFIVDNENISSINFLDDELITGGYIQNIQIIKNSISGNIRIFVNGPTPLGPVKITDNNIGGNIKLYFCFDGLIENNTIGTGIFTEGSYMVKISKNKISGDVSNIGEFGTSYNSMCNNFISGTVLFPATMMYNTIAGGSFSTATVTARGYGFLNNIIINPGGGPAFSTSLGIPFSDYNDFYNGGNNNLIEYLGTTYNNLSDFYNATGLDQHSNSIPVTFMSPTDLHLAGSSIGDEALVGTPIPSITDDFDGDTRSQFFPYKGADENTDFPLPVELASFTSLVNKNNVLLSWITSSEVNNNGFDIERSNGKGQTPNEWMKIAFVQGNGTTTSPNNYAYTDRGLNLGKYKYRLKQIDFNGNFKYYNLSNEVTIGVPEKYSLSQNFPNPFNPGTLITYSIPTTQYSVLKVYDVMGKEVQVLVNEKLSPGTYEAQFDGSNLSSGVYFYKLEAGDFVETKRMVLLK